MWYWKILVPLIGYLIGCANFGIIVSKLAFKQDIRLFGSGNAGTTNTFRVYGKAAGIFVLAADVLKGVGAVLLTKWLEGQGLLGEAKGLWPALAGFCVILGHIYPVFFKFKGGKGVATMAGIMAALQPPVFLILLVFPFLTLLLTVKYMSVASISTVAALPAATFIWHGLEPGGAWELTPLFWVSAAILALVVFTHRENIKRLIAGNENKLFQKKGKKEES